MIEQRKKLNGPEQYQLNKIVEARYAKSGLTNSAFAESINDTPEERKFFRWPLNASHILSALTATQTPTNFQRQPRAKLEYASKVDQEATITLLTELATRVSKLEALAHSRKK